MPKKYIGFIISFFLTIATFAQTDTEFWFVAPEVSQTGGSNYDRPIVFKITTYEQAAYVTIAQPANTLNQAINIPANSSQTVDVTAWINTIENKPANSVLTYGIKITSTTPITVYYEVIPK